MAATSRPDLIDAALLRPGRLDRAIFCGLPTTPERAEILRALARKLPLAPGVDLTQIAALTSGLTGAFLLSGHTGRTCRVHNAQVGAGVG